MRRTKIETYTVTRTADFSLKYGNTGKLEFLDKLVSGISFFVNYFLSISNGKKVPYAAVKQIDDTRGLSRRYLGMALHIANNILASTKKKGKTPTFKAESIILDYRFVDIQVGRNSFDFWLKIRNPYTKKWVYIPFKDYKYHQERFDGWERRKTVGLIKKDGNWYLRVFYRRQVVSLYTPFVKAIDFGINTFITTNTGEKIYGELKDDIEALNRKKQGSKAWKKKKQDIINKINRALKQVVDNEHLIVIEDLRNIKSSTKKKKKVGKSTRKLLHGWYIGHARRRLRDLTQEAGVQLLEVPAKGTSRTCPVCLHEDTRSRNGTKFKCINCGFENDADFVGALNIEKRFVAYLLPRELSVPLPAKPPYDIFD